MSMNNVLHYYYCHSVEDCAIRRRSLKRSLFLLLLVVGAIFRCAPEAFANVTVTAATGGTNISADKAQNATSPVFTTLGNIVITEVTKDEFADTGGLSRTLILTAPSGWRFNVGVGTITPNASANIPAASLSVSATTITVTLTVSGNNKTDSITISGI